MRNQHLPVLFPRHSKDRCIADSLQESAYAFKSINKVKLIDLSLDCLQISLLISAFWVRQ